MPTNKKNSRDTSMTSKKRPMISFGRAIGNFWRGYFNFSGRATRAEYWFNILFLMMVTTPLMICAVAWIVYETTFGSMEMQYMLSDMMWLIFLPIFFPMLAQGTRRFRDAGIPVALFLIPTVVSWILQFLPMDEFGTLVFCLLFSWPLSIFVMIVACLPSKK